MARGMFRRWIGMRYVAPVLALLLTGLFVSPAAWSAVVWTNTSDDELWNTLANWSGGAPPLATDDVLFPTPIPGTGTPSEITLGAGEVAKSLEFDDSYSLTGGDLTLSSGAIDVALASRATIDSLLHGTAGLTKTGYGTLRLGNASNDYTGATTINRGLVIILSSGALGADSSQVVVAGNQTRGVGGGQLLVGGLGSPINFTRGLSLSGGGPAGDGMALVSVGDNTLAAVTTSSTIGTRLGSGFGQTTIGALTVGGGVTTQLAGNGHWVINGGLTVPSTASTILEKTGSGTLILGGLNNVNNEIRVSGGFLRLASAPAPVSTLGANGGTLELRTNNGSSFATTKLVLRNGTTIFADRAVGSVTSPINQTVVFSDSSSATNNQTYTFTGRNGYGITLTGAGGPTGNIGLTSGNPTTFNNNSNGVLTFNGNINLSDNTARTIFFGGNAETLITGNLTLTGNNPHNVTKNGAGTLTIAGGASTYAGATNISAGTLAIRQFGGINAGTTSGALNIGNQTTTSGTLNYLGAAGTGAGETVTKLINLNTTTANVYINANQTGSAPSALIINGTISALTGDKTLVLGGGNALDNEIQSVIPTAGGTLSVQKIGSGTWVLSGANGASGYTGNTNVSGGTLKIKDTFSGSSRNVFNDGAAVFFNVDSFTNAAGGTFEYVGAASSASTERVGSLGAFAGNGVVRVTPGAGGSAALTFGIFNSSSVGSAIDFVVPAGGSVALGNQSGFVNPRLTFNGSHFAFAGAGGGVLRAPIYGSDAGFSTSAVALTANEHNQITGSFTSDLVTVKSLRISGSQTLTMTGLLTLSSSTNSAGSILQAGGAGEIAGTGVTAAGTGDLWVRVDGSSDQLTLSAPITAPTSGGLTKTGAGTLVLNAVNAQTGTVNVNEGTLKLAGSATLGAPNIGVMVRQGGILDLGGVNTGATIVGAFNGAGTVTNSAASTTATLTFGNNNQNGYFTGILQDGAGRLAMTKVGTGTGSLTGASTFSGPVTLSGGTLAVTSLADIGAASALGRGDASDNATNAASLVFNGGTLLYTGASATIFQATGTPSVSINRLFTLAGNGTIDSSGQYGSNVLAAGAANNATLIFNNTAPVAFSGSGARTLTLQGNSTGDNELKLQLVNNGADPLSLTKMGTGVWILGGSANSYTGNTTISNGVLQAVDGAGLSVGSPLVLGGGVFQSSGTFTRDLAAGATAGRVTWSAGGGFAASGDELVVALGGAASPIALTWGSGGFVPTGSLVLSSTTALAEVDFRNPINLGTASRTIQVDDNTSTGLDFAILSGDITGGTGGSINKTGTGTLVLTGVNTYTGGAQISAGAITVPSISRLGTGTTLKIGNGGTAGTLNYVGGGETTALVVDLAGTTGGATIDSSGYGALILTSNLTASGGGSKTLTLRGINNDINEIKGNIVNSTSATSVTKTDSGTWLLSGANTYTGGTTVSGGLLGLGSDAAIGTGTLTITDGSLFSVGADRSFGNSVTISGGTANVFTGDYSLAFSGTLLNTGGSRNLDNFLPAGKTLTFSGPITLAENNQGRTLNVRGSGTTIFTGTVSKGTGSGADGLTLNGAGATLILSNATPNANDYDGTTTITQGTLRLGASEQLPHGASAGNVTMNPGTGLSATFDLNGKNETINGLTATSAGITIIDNSAAEAVSLTFGDKDAAVSFTAALGEIKNTGGGPLSLVKIGTGAATISNAALGYTGATTVAGGTMTISAALSATSALNASSGGVLNVTGPLTAPPTVSVAGAGSAVNLTGTLSSPSSLTSLTVGGGSTLNLVNSGGTHFDSLTTLNLGTADSTATLGLDIGSSWDRFTAIAPATTAGNVAINIAAASGFGLASTYDLFSAPSGLSGASYSVGVGGPIGYAYGFNVTDSLVQLTVTPAPIDVYWRGSVNNSWAGLSGPNVNWTTDLDGTANAGGTPGPTTTAVFSSTGAPGTTVSTTLDRDFFVNDLKFTTNPTGVTAATIAAGTPATSKLTIAPSSSSKGIDVADNAGTITISAPLEVGAAQTWNVTGTGNSLTASGALSGSGNLIKTGAGKATLSGNANAFAGSLTLAGGTLETRSNGTGSGQFITFGSGSGANVQVTADSTLHVDRVASNFGSMIGFGGLTIGGQNLTVTGTTTTTFGTGATASYSAVFTGPTNITGDATFTLGTSTTAAARIDLMGVASGAGRNITVSGPNVPHASLRLTNTSSATPNNFAGSTFTVNAGATLEGRVAIGGVDDGTSSLGTAGVTLAGGTLRISPQLGTAVSGDPGFLARYYNGTPTGNNLFVFNYFATPTGTNTTAVINAPNNSSALVPGAGMTPLPPGVNVQNVTALWNGVFNITTAGYYGFNSPSDDGTQIFIDGTLVVNNNGNHGLTGQMPWSSIYLTAGPHVFVERFYQGTGGAQAITSYQGPDTGGALVLLGSIAGSVVTPTSLPTAAFPNAVTLSGSDTSTIDLAVDSTIPSLSTTAGTGATLNVSSSGLNALTVVGATTLGSNLAISPNNVNASSVTLAEPVSGDFALIKAGGGVLTLNGGNSHLGGTTLSAGTLNLGHASALGSAALTITGGSLDNTTGAAMTLATNNLQNWDGNFAFLGTHDLNLGAGAVTLSATRQITVAAGSLTVGGVIDDGVGPFGVTKAGAGTLILGQANAYDGATSVDLGTLKFAVDQNLVGGLNFGSANTITTAGTLDLSTTNATFGGAMVVQTNTATANTLTIGAGKTLTINNNVTIGTGQAAGTTTALTAMGGGKLVVNNPAASGFFNVGGTTTGANQGNCATADLSGLSELAITLDTATGTVRVNPINTNNVTDKFSTLILPSTGLGKTTITANTLALGDSGQNNGPGQANVLLLGTGLNAINVNTINIGTGNRDNGSLSFNGPTGSLVVRNAAGTGKTALNIGTGSANTGVLGDNNVFDVRGHDVDLLFSTVNIGTQPRSANMTNEFHFDQGVLTMDSLTMSTKGTGGSTTNNGDRITDSFFNIGGGTVAILNGVLNLGQVTSTSGNMLLAIFTANGTINVSGGNVTIGATSSTSIRMADAIANTQASGTLNFTGGVTTLSGDIIKGGGGGTTTATLNLDGGTLDMGGRLIGSAVSPLNTLVFASGVLKNVGAINGTGGLTKTSGGTLRLEGYNQYVGNTVVDAGTLLAQNTVGSATGTGAVVVNSGGTLGGTGIIAGPVTVNNGGTLTGGGLGSVGTLTINNSLVLNSLSSSIFDFASPTSFDTIAGLTGITYGGTLTAQGSVTARSYQLFNFTGSYGNTFSSIVVPVGYTGSFNYATGTLTIDTASTTTRVWTGGGSGNNIGTSANWDTNVPGSGDAVVFGALGAGKPNPTNETARAVGPVTFDAAGYNVGGAKLTVNGAIVNNAATATISAAVEMGAGPGAGVLSAATGTTLLLSGTLSGSTGVTKEGNGRVVIDVPAYTGDTVVNAGVLETAGLAGTGATTVNGGQLIADYVRQSSLTIGPGGRVEIAPSTSVPGSLSLLSTPDELGEVAPLPPGAFAVGGGAVAGDATLSPPTAVPEPGTWLLLTTAALAGLLVWRRRGRGEKRG